MAHISIFRFRISNKASSTYVDDTRTAWYGTEVKQLSSAVQITETLEKFIQGRKILSIEITPITCKQNHDRDRDDTVDLFYTILWEEDVDFGIEENKRKKDYSNLEVINKINQQPNYTRNYDTKENNYIDNFENKVEKISNPIWNINTKQQ